MKPLRRSEQNPDYARESIYRCMGLTRKGTRCTRIAEYEANGRHFCETHHSHYLDNKLKAK